MENQRKIKYTRTKKKAESYTMKLVTIIKLFNPIDQMTLLCKQKLVNPHLTRMDREF